MKITKELIEKVGAPVNYKGISPLPWEIHYEMQIPGYYICDANDELVLCSGMEADPDDLDLIVNLLIKVFPDFPPNT